MGHGWYIKEIATIFLAMGIFSGIAANKSPNAITKLFLDGAKDILPAAMIVGLARGIVVILEDGKIIDTILFLCFRFDAKFWRSGNRRNYVPDTNHA